MPVADLDRWTWSFSFLSQCSILPKSNTWTSNSAPQPAHVTPRLLCTELYFFIDDRGLKPFITCLQTFLDSSVSNTRSHVFWLSRSADRDRKSVSIVGAGAQICDSPLPGAAFDSPPLRTCRADPAAHLVPSDRPRALTPHGRGSETTLACTQWKHSLLQHLSLMCVIKDLSPALLPGPKATIVFVVVIDIVFHPYNTKQSDHDSDANVEVERVF